MRTTTDAANWPFYFTITDLARFLGKSPVTLRGWEKQGIIKFPRDEGGDRKLSSGEVRNAAQVAQKLKRITKHRLRMIEAALTILQLIERENIK
jgi:hypothetical protein